LSVVAGVLKIASTLSAHTTVPVVSVFIVGKNGPEITVVLKTTFSCMFYRSFGIFVTTRTVRKIVSRKREQLKLRCYWQYL